MLITAINPVSIFPDTATYLAISNAAITKFGSNGSGVLCWQLLNSAKAILKNGVIELSGSDYQGWNDDDPYLLELACTKLGVTKA